VVETKKPPVDGFVRRDLPGCVVCSAVQPVPLGAAPSLVARRRTGGPAVPLDRLARGGAVPSPGSAHHNV